MLTTDNSKSQPRIGIGAGRNRQERRAMAAGVAPTAETEPAAWRIKPWRRQVPISNSKFYEKSLPAGSR